MPPMPSPLLTRQVSWAGGLSCAHIGKPLAQNKHAVPHATGSKKMAPSLLRSVAQPTTPSVVIAQRIRLSPAAATGHGPSTTSKISPGSAWRTASASLAAKDGVSATFALQVYDGFHGLNGGNGPAEKQTQPALPSSKDLARTPSLTFGRTSLGASSPCRISPLLNLRSSEEPVSRDSRSTISVSTLKCVLLGSTYTVPWLPLSVTHPSLASCAPRNFSRLIPFSSLWPSCPDTRMSASPMDTF